MATPKAFVFIDFNEDGDFTDSGEDVTSDVRWLRFSGGKAITKYRVEASQLELNLSNDDHKYSPSKSTTKFDRVKLSPIVWFLLGYPVDTFDASNGTDLASRKPDFDSTFSAWSGDTSDFTVLSNKLRTSVGANKSAVLDFGEVHCFVGCRYTRGGTTSGVIIRFTDASNYLLVYHDGTSIRLGEVVSGTLTSLASATFTWAAGDEKWILIELHGNDIRVSVDNAFQFTHTTTRFNTVTKHGIGGRATHADDRWDDFGGWRSMFYGRLDSVQPRPIQSRQYAYMRCLDDMERLGRHLVFRLAPAVPTTAKAIIGEILDAANFSSGNRILDTGETLTIKTNTKAAMGRDALTELYQVQDDDVGFFFIDGSGYARYEETQHRYPVSGHHLTSLKTWFASKQTPAESDIYFQDLIWDDGKGEVENEIYYKFHHTSLAALAEVWRIHPDDKAVVRNGQFTTFGALGEGDQIVAPVLPVHSTDVNIDSATGGGGTDLHAVQDSQQGTVSVIGSPTFTLDDTTQDFTEWLTRVDVKYYVVVITDTDGDYATAFIGTTDVDGDGTKVALFTDKDLGTAGYIEDTGLNTGQTLTYNIYHITVEFETGFDGNYKAVRIGNFSGSDGFVQTLRMRAQKGTKANESIARAEHAVSRTNIGRRRVDHTTLHIDLFNHDKLSPTTAGGAQERARARLGKRSIPHEWIIVTMMNATQANLMQIVHRSMSDLVSINYSDMGINSRYFVERKGFEMKEGNTFVECDWELRDKENWTYGSDSNNARYDESTWA